MASLASANVVVQPDDHDLDITTMNNIDREKFLHVPEVQDDKFDIFVQWIQENGGKFPKLYLKKYDEANRGVHASEVIEDDEMIMEIPYACVFNVEMGKATSTGQLVLKANIEHRFDAPKHIYLMLFLLIDGEDENSFFQPYYKILPESLSGMPVFWTEEEYAYLKGSYLLNQTQMRKDAILKDYEEILTVDSEFSRFTLEEFAWARMIVCSRNFGGMINGVKSSGMVPMADMLNHYRPRETRWGFDEETNMFTIHACCDIGVGDSVYDSYGKKCQHRFLLNYGFAIENNREPDGRNPNQLHMIFDLELEDPALKLKHMLLEQAMRISKDQTRRGIRVSTVYVEKTTMEAFSYLRFIHMTESELMPYFPRVQAGSWDITRELKFPISLDNEEKVLRTLGRICMTQLKGYDTTWEEDKAKLADPNGPNPFTNERNALIYMAGEKEICHYYIDLMMEGVKYIRMLKTRDVDVARELQSLLRDKYADHDQIASYSGSCEYVSHVIVNLLKKTFRMVNTNEDQEGGGAEGGVTRSGGGKKKNKRR